MKVVKIKQVKISSEQKAIVAGMFSGKMLHVQGLNFKGNKYACALIEKNNVIENAAPRISTLNKLISTLSVLPRKEQETISNLDTSLSVYRMRRHKKNILDVSGRKNVKRVLINLDGYITLSDNIDLCDISPLIERAHRRSPAGQKAQERSLNRQMRTREVHLFGSIYAKKVGGVFVEPGMFLIAHKAKMNAILETNKKPMTSERHTGTEIEFLMKREERLNLETALRESDFKNYLTLGRDGSVHGDNDEIGAELKICVPNSKLVDCINQVSAILKAHGSTVNKTCGLHIHLDARNDEPKKMFINLVNQQAALFKLVPSSRRNNQYCKHTAAKDYLSGDRYKAVNSLAFNRYKTIEVRLHSGTIEAEKIISWASLLQTIAYNTNEVSRSRSVETMVEKFSLSQSLKNYLVNRAAKFNDGSSNSESEEAA